ncbi:MAG: hypothetical protein DMF56_01275 [Acidobacteria bacterium]|nr:MAG: hypothetical protein DMF56_01275 [Acidobacteriota bacterium]
MESRVPRLILVPTDFSAPAAHALRYASALAERFDAHLLVLYADLFMVPVDFMASAAGAFDVARDAMIDKAQQQLLAHAEQCIGRGVPFDTRVLVNRAAEAIGDQVRETGADLIIMGTHGRTGVRRVLLGSVTEAVMRVAKVPVIAVNPRSAGHAKVEKIVCPVDYTPACADALLRAAALAPQADIVLVRSVDRFGECFDELPRLRAWAPPELVSRCELKLMTANASASEIVAFAKDLDADLIALGLAGDRSLVKIIQHSTCPVLTVSGAAPRTRPVEERVSEPAVAV